MKLIKKYGLFIFWGILILDCIFCLVNAKSNRIYTKTLLLPTLAIYFYINTKRGKHSTSKTFIYASLLMAWLGDLLILKNDLRTNDFFLAFGFTALITAFSIYGLMFKRMFPIKIKDCQEAFLGFVSIIVVCGVFYSFLNSLDLLNFKLPIISGMIIMCVVMAFATNLIKDKVRNNMAVQFFVPGIIILSLSLGILIASRFLLKEADFLPAVIMLTYGYGQMLVIRGFTKYLKA